MLDFDSRRECREAHHSSYVSEEEFELIFNLVRDAGLGLRSQPWSREDLRGRSFPGGRTVFFRDFDGHPLELRTRTSRQEVEDARWTAAAVGAEKS